MKAAKNSSRETEIKLPAADAPSARRLLIRAGFRVSKRRIFENNLVLDTPDGALRGSARLLRIREAGRSATLTYKGPPQPGKHKDREELETRAEDAGKLKAIFERLGYGVSTRYEKYRTEFRQGTRGGTATLDETPIGVFLELEGPPDWIDRTARKLGFAESEYISASYGRLYEEWCARKGLQPRVMAFDSGG